MAFDKVIDSAALDSGMTATANAIREKTGGANPIIWDVSNGFKSAVEAIQTGGGGIVPGMTVIKGQYIPGTTVPGMAGSFLKIDHNIGEVKPFAFHMEIADPSKAGGDNCIIAVNISMLSYDTKTISYSDKTADITPIATVQVKQANNINRGNNPSSVNVYDTTEAANASGNATNFNLKVWPDGFKTALYQALQSGAVYDYTLVYGM